VQGGNSTRWLSDDSCRVREAETRKTREQAAVVQSRGQQSGRRQGGGDWVAKQRSGWSNCLVRFLEAKEVVVVVLATCKRREVPALHRAQLLQGAPPPGSQWPAWLAWVASRSLWSRSRQSALGRRYLSGLLLYTHADWLKIACLISLNVHTNNLNESLLTLVNLAGRATTSSRSPKIPPLARRLNARHWSREGGPQSNLLVLT
jgi:hypothetical protein